MDKLIAAILVITGAASMEELDESVIERFEYYSENPVCLNTAGKTRLLDSGLMNAFQLASLMDYRSRSGDVLSVTELGTVDGFGPVYAEALGLFVSFDSSRPAGSTSGSYLTPRSNLTARFGERSDKENSAAGVKYNLQLGDRFELNWASRTTYSAPDFTPGSGNVTFYLHRRPGKLTVGDFNARFGQGLLLWNGFITSSYTTASSLQRNATGLSPSKSATGARRGAAAEMGFGPWTVSAAVAMDGTLLANASFLSRAAQAGFTLLQSPSGPGASTDWKVGYRGGVFFGEAAYMNGFRVAAGTSWIPSYGRRLAFLARWSDTEHLAAAAWSGRNSDLSAEASYKSGKKRFRATALLRPEWKTGGLEIRPSLRISGKSVLPGTPFRTEIRTNLGLGYTALAFNLRYDYVHCRSDAWLCYAEVGWKGALSLWLRGGIFKVDNWDDRIYVYERDAPGTFNVPSYYGRGWNASLVCGWKTKRRGFWLRASSLRYPWIDKPAVYELRLQYSRSFRRGY